MKITDVSLSDPLYMDAPVTTDATVNNPSFRAMSRIQVTSDDGNTGFATIYEPQIGRKGNDLIKTLVEDAFRPLVVGEDPMDTERIWDRLYWGSVRWGRRGAVLGVIGGIDIALWDLKGKILNQPVHKLLGAHRDTVAAYGSSVSLGVSNEELARIYSGFVEAGFKMVKMKVGRRNRNEDVERVKLVRETVGPDVDIALDVNSGWSLNTALRMCERLEPFNIYWLEEPIPPDQLDNHEKLAAGTSIPIALGETHMGKWEFRELIERGAMQFVQADIVRCGGVTEWIKIAAIADSYGLPMCPHATTELATSLVAAVPNGLFVECFRTEVPPDSPVKDVILPRNGEISPSSKPGFGIEFDEDVIRELQSRPVPDADKLYAPTRRGWQWPPYL